MVAKTSETATGEIKCTNHSLRATTASRMFVKNVPEKIITKKLDTKVLVDYRHMNKQIWIENELHQAFCMGSSEAASIKNP